MVVDRFSFKLFSVALSAVVAFSLTPLASASSAYAAEGALVAASVTSGETQAGTASVNAVLLSDNTIYASSSSGAKTGNLASAAEAETLEEALSAVSTLYVGNAVTSVGSVVKVSTDAGEVSVTLSQLVNLKKVVFLTSTKRNAAAVKSAKSTAAKASKARAAAVSKEKAAKKKWSTLATLWKSRKTLKSQGSMGYFRYYSALGDAGAKAAIKALKRQGYSTKDSDGRKFASFTHIGNSKDATSLANFEKAVKWIPRGNKLRTTDNHFKGRKALRVSDVIMAMAQSHANWSNSHLNHAGNCGSNYPVGENLAWNYGSDPYYQWYTEEKAAYEGRTTGQTGHYLNLLESSYTSTGFAVCTYGSMNGWTTYCQQFRWAPVAGEKLYTVAQYKKRIATYKKFLASGSKQVKSAKTAYRKAVAARKGADAALKAAQSALKAEKKRAVSACKTVGDRAFEGCAALASVSNFNKTLATSIGERAFAGCSALSNVRMPYTTLKTVGASAFSGCAKLTATPSVSLAAKGSIASIKAQAFKPGKAAKPTVVVKVGKKKLTKGADYTVRYTGNYTKGTAKAIVTGCGKYYGSKTVKFTIK